MWRWSRSSSGPDGGYVEVPHRKAVVRTDIRRVLAVMTDRYVPVQNREAFSFFDTVVSAGEAIYHTAGSLRGGRRIWVLAKLPGDLRVSQTDILEKYILLVNSHDGSAAVTMRPTTIRVVCNNTLTGAVGAARRPRVAHLPSRRRHAARQRCAGDARPTRGSL